MISPFPRLRWFYRLYRAWDHFHDVLDDGHIAKAERAFEKIVLLEDEGRAQGWFKPHHATCFMRKGIMG